MTPDPKWLEILKASGWQSLAIAIACTSFLWIEHSGWVPKPPDWTFSAALFGALLFGCLTVASFITAVLKFFPIQEFIIDEIITRREQKWLRNYIPNMTDREKEILAYLLVKNQRTFIAAQDGGYAMPLISHRIVIRALQPGQVFSSENTPFVIPNHMWKTLNEHREKFLTHSIEPSANYEPWRVPWMER
ncbi:MAG TPA: super-infection exclusion protein B [Rhizomicrobium sp.]|jgi:hypothetical protein|nr:super-infection exclusion protein B [Rhizomicrobium sp.]